jgi:O-antigen/teichoic acid export membrane protein
MNLAHAFMIGLGRVKPLLAIDSAAAVINLSLAFILIPSLHDVGAALANLIGQCVVAVIVTAYALRAMNAVRVPVAQIVRTAIVAGAGGLAAYLVVEALTGVPGLVLGLIVGAVLFLAFGALLKIIRDDDAHWLLGSTAGTPVATPVALLCRLFSNHRTDAA